MLQFIGCGSAFNTKLGNTSSFLRKKDTLLIIDCGGNIFQKIMEKQLLNGIKNIYVIVTRMHPDHIGSLGDLIFYSYYILNNKLAIIYPDINNLSNCLTLMGIDKNLYSIYAHDDIAVELLDNNFGKITIYPTLTPHVNQMQSYSYYIYTKNFSFFYSGDTGEFNHNALDELKYGNIDIIYQEVCGIDYENNVHTYIDKILKSVDNIKLRKKIILMHFDENIDLKKLEEYGFGLAENI